MKTTNDRHSVPPRRPGAILVGVAAFLVPTLLGLSEAWPAGAMPQDSKLHVVATLTDLGDLARQVGGDRVEVTCLCRGNEDPHYVSPTPTLMMEANRADLYIEVGLELELWSEQILEGARNPRILVGTPGHLYAGEGIRTLEKPAVISRAAGDVHPQGNPHVYISPVNVRQMAGNIAAGLRRIDPSGAETYDRNLKRFQKQLDAALFGDELPRLIAADQLVRLVETGKVYEFLESKSFGGKPLIDRLGGWLGRMRGFRESAVIAHHKTWSYLARDFEFEIVDCIEPKPGLTPTPGHLARLQEEIASRDVRVIIYAPYYPSSYAEGLGAETGRPVRKVPSSVGGVPGTDDVFSKFDAIVDILTRAQE